MVIMAAKQTVRTEIEVLLLTVARDVRRIGDTEASPHFVALAPWIYFPNGKSRHCEMERRGQVSPQSVTIEVGSIQNIPHSIDSFALRVLRRVKPFFEDRPINFLYGDPIRCEIGALILSAERGDRSPLALRCHCHAPWCGILGRALHPE
jgi:hypothetical protein